MKIRISFKDPDALSEAFDDEERKIEKSLTNLTPAGAKAEAAARIESLRDLASKFFEYSEYVVIELDDEAQTATVVLR